ncbi:MAG: right-handed parallel beta-helix repeat-containing protein [Verrucomicrobiae bacterium]|nr:right-handed parallel beta-helix repeat-containing protein [Verrucomicrobiae bacterium]
MAAQMPCERSTFFVLISIASLSWNVAAGADYYVSPAGADANPGSLAAPWKTLQKAASTVPAGSTVYLRAGVYSEKVEIDVSGNAVDGPVVFKAYPGEEPILDGTALPFDPDNSNALIAIHGQSHLRIEGLTLRNFGTATRYLTPVGILVEDASHHIEIVGNLIHGIETRYGGLDGGDAHGIAVFGSAATPISDLLIAENELYGLRLGSSEALVLNGNVTTFEVRDNVVRDCNNIAIDFIGYEGTAPSPALDRARDGSCRGNLVFHINSAFNPAYGGNPANGGGDTSAGGLYVDGGARILIEGNVVHHANIGIELASEHAGRTTEAITVRDNLLYHNTIGGLFLGGYDRRRGATRNCLVENNTFFENDTRRDGNGELYLQFDVRGCTFRHNLFRTNGQGLLIGNPYTENSGNALDYQLYFSPNGSKEWQWKTVYYTGFQAYRNASNQDGHSLVADPQFSDPSVHDFRLAPGSPGREQGTPGHQPDPGDEDLIGSPRLSGMRVDLGAFEDPGVDPGAVPVLSGKSVVIANGDDTPDPVDGTNLGTLTWRRDNPLVGAYLVTNTGSDEFRPVFFSVTGAGAAAFRLHRSFAVVPAGESRPLAVIFDPPAPGLFPAELIVHGAYDGGHELRFSLLGEALPPDYLPDERVGARSDTPVGNGIYGTSGTGQLFSLYLKRRSGLAWFRAENDGALADNLRLAGSRGNRFLRVSFFRSSPGGRNNVTAALFSGADLLPLASGEGRDDECRLLRSRRGRDRKFRKTIAVSATSDSAPAENDRTILRVKAR